MSVYVSEGRIHMVNMLQTYLCIEILQCINESVRIVSKFEVCCKFLK